MRVRYVSVVFVCVCVCVYPYAAVCCAYQNPLVAFVEIINNDTKKLQTAADDAEFPLRVSLQRETRGLDLHSKKKHFKL